MGCAGVGEVGCVLVCEFALEISSKDFDHPPLLKTDLRRWKYRYLSPPWRNRYCLFPRVEWSRYCIEFNTDCIMWSKYSLIQNGTSVFPIFFFFMPHFPRLNWTDNTRLLFQLKKKISIWNPNSLLYQALWKVNKQIYIWWTSYLNKSDILSDKIT